MSNYFSGLDVVQAEQIIRVTFLGFSGIIVTAVAIELGLWFAEKVVKLLLSAFR